ncbi:2-oxoglutarate dehydrogenase E1 component [Malassezia pachydermatis]|uniref:2-oxoglutarate dehydrogenase, mitochondrial n=1 Tax=Malassezia pachydermatis TaxID=77020 RepID=A0A0M8MIL2_9BASI|nr:2-oxoglutarate dehydrogenase complex e1 component mitochondrial precursor [Malassezia pachydermatis]KOS13196.1 2-oxoglutarate dehydrogenase complex e1 component mitochondrial precursor [Malassezia pachydermatis]
MMRPISKAPLRALSMSRARQPFPTSSGWRMLTSSARVANVQSSKPSPPSPNDSFANTTNAFYAEQMYRHWKEDPKSVHSSWDAYFSGLDNGLPSSQAFQPAPSQLAMPGTGGIEQAPDHPADDYLKLQLLVRAHQVRGHMLAKIDPLGILDSERAKNVPKEMDPSYYGWSEKDLDKEMQLGPGVLPNFVSKGTKTLTIRQIIDACRSTYCGSIGYEYVHVPDRKKCDWLRARIEVPEPYKYSVEEKRRIFDRLTWSDSFERFIASKYPNEKRFGLEGAESMIPGIKTIIDRAVEFGVSSVTMGMPHRGRLNVLGNVIRRPIEGILHQFADHSNEDGGGDVKYHLGANYVRPTPSGSKVSLSLVANPSHLEAEDPVVLGKTRAIQEFNKDKEHKTSMALLLHGDAAFAGQGVVYETMGMYNLPKYATGGTIHIIVNNQIGFTTDPRFARSTMYPSDIAKSIEAPIFHVNADDVEAVDFICKLAVDYRNEFKKDVVIDLMCYRRHGHNEIDQPSFTQPRMYEAIAKQVPTLKHYAKRLVDEGSFTQEEVDEHEKWVWGMLQEAYEKSKTYEPEERQWLSSAWEGFPSPKELKENILEQRETGVDLERLKYIGNAASSYPEGFTVHKNLVRILKNRIKAVESGEGIDMSTAEALAFGSLAMEDIFVRISGQDVERGTFSQRHAVLHDQKNEETYTPLDHLSEDQAPFSICNSSLSEYGALGFELGFSLVDPKNLTIWEAQFGDFANTAQCIIDQFIASGEHKWLQRTGLVLNLPHGYDGQGPEHSSARIERFLQLCDDHPYHFPTKEELQRQHQDSNMAVVYCTTPANVFHVLRRQVHRDFRKPLIHLFSKSLLRHPEARSKLEDMGPGTYFQRYIPEPHNSEGKDELVPPEEIKRHILTCGQTYFALLQYRRENNIKDVAISRIEQIAPLHYEALVESLDKYPNADLMYAQEEPLNNGAWSYLEPRLRTTCNHTEHHKGKEFMVASRPPSSSVATGNKGAHQAELKAYVKAAFNLDRSVHDDH